MQASLINLFAQMRHMQTMYHQYQAALQMPGSSPQQRTALLAHIGQLQPNINITNQQFTQQLALAKSMLAANSTADKVSEVLDESQQAQVREWQKSVDQTTRANSFKVRETGIYQGREEMYRKVLEGQRKHNAATTLAMQREREAEKHWLAQPHPWGRGYNGYGNGVTSTQHHHHHHSNSGGVTL
ncbi:hypothetical protein GGH91_005533, partial [Coemansia sp. RSA 2671]